MYSQHMAQRVQVLTFASSAFQFQHSCKRQLPKLARALTIAAMFNDKNHKKESHGSGSGSGRQFSTLNEPKSWEKSTKEAVDKNANKVGVSANELDYEERSYQDAIAQLNSLQSNADVIKAITSPSHKAPPHSETLEYLHRAGLLLEQFDSLKVIHVAGTKGKGSTCAFVESILRKFGLRTGLFTSPHLISTRERIRIDGEPLNRADFAKYFFQTYEGMRKAMKHQNDMPAYFRFLTCMAYYVFYHEKVDVAIMEVGIGGTHDSTNIVRYPVVVGITSLGLDHQNVLGNTLEEITMQKAGIMKPNVPIFTTSTHPPNILGLLKGHAHQTKCPIFVSSPLHEFNNNDSIHLGIHGPVSQINAALALQLSQAFLATCFPQKLRSQDSQASWKFGSAFQLSKLHFEGLADCRWDGRFQALRRRDNLIYFMDGAHTVESLLATRMWFFENHQENSIRILVFHVTGDRNVKDHMAPFAELPFDKVLFCPLSIGTKVSGGSDTWSVLRTDHANDAKLREQAETWSTLSGNNSNSVILGSVTEVVDYLDQISVTGQSRTNYNVLVTGSLYLVGSFLSVFSS